MLDSTHGMAENLMKLYVTHMSRLRDTWGGLTGIKVLSSVTIRYRILFYMVNCAIKLVCKQESGGVLLTNEMASNKLGVVEATITMVLVKKNLHKKLVGKTAEGYIRR